MSYEIRLYSRQQKYDKQSSLIISNRIVIKTTFELIRQHSTSH